MGNFEEIFDRALTKLPVSIVIVILESIKKIEIAIHENTFITCDQNDQVIHPCYVLT